MLKLRQTSAAVILTLVLSLSGAAGQTADFSALRETVRQELEATKTSSASVLIIKSDRVIFSESFGAANVETNQTLTTETLFHIGSYSPVV